MARLLTLINAAVDTVERFQGQQRDVIFASFRLGDPEVIANEDEFLYSLFRFNVLVSRARVKVVVFCHAQYWSISPTIRMSCASRLCSSGLWNRFGEAKKSSNYHFSMMAVRVRLG